MVFSIQAWLGESEETRRSSSTPGYFSVGMSCTLLFPPPPLEFLSGALLTTCTFVCLMQSWPSLSPTCRSFCLNSPAPRPSQGPRSQPRPRSSIAAEACRRANSEETKSCAYQLRGRLCVG